MNETFDFGLLLASLGLKRCLVSGSLLPEGHKARKGNQGRAQHRQRHGYLQNGKLDNIKKVKKPIRFQSYMSLAKNRGGRVGVKENF